MQRTTTTVSELPDARRWMGRDWIKLVIAAVLALALIRISPAANQVSVAPTAIPGTTIPAVVSGPTAAPTVGASVVPSAAVAIISAPTIMLGSNEVFAGPITLNGTGTPGSTVRVTLNGAELGTALVNPDGTWTLDTQLPAGEVTIVAEAIDTAGAVVATGEPLTATVGTGTLGGAAAAGGALAITTPLEGAQFDPGLLTISGTGVPGTILEVLNSDKVVAETTIGDGGTWSVEVNLPEGTAALSVREKGAADIAGRPIRVTIGQVAANSCASLEVNCTAYVTRQGGFMLRVRSAGRVAPDNITTRLPIGTQLTLLAGPQPADGFSWWQVRTLGGNEGWVAGENLVIQPD